jgi:hypothetical protein
MVTLVAIDDQRVGRKFVADDGSSPDEGQGVSYPNHVPDIFSPMLIVLFAS